MIANTYLAFNDVSFTLSLVHALNSNNIFSCIVRCNSKRKFFTIDHYSNVCVINTHYSTIFCKSVCILFFTLRLLFLTRFYVAHAGGVFLRALFCSGIVDGYIEEGLTHLNLSISRYNLSKNVIGFSDFSSNQFGYNCLPTLSMATFVSLKTFSVRPSISPFNHYAESCVIQSRGIDTKAWDYIVSFSSSVVAVRHPSSKKNSSIPSFVDTFGSPNEGVESLFPFLVNFNTLFFGSSSTIIFFAIYLASLNSRNSNISINCILAPPFLDIKSVYYSLKLPLKVNFIDFEC